MLYGMTMDELRREQPHIFELLKTEFHVLITAYSDGEKIRFSLPLLPPPIHTFIYECNSNEVEKLTSEDFFLRTIISSTNIPIDELLISSLRYAQDARKKDKDYVGFSFHFFGLIFIKVLLAVITPSISGDS